MAMTYSLNTRRLARYYSRDKGVSCDSGIGISIEKYADKSQNNDPKLPKESAAKVSLSPKARRRLQNSINWLTACSAKRKVSINSGKSSFFFRVGFVTLTLPCKQLHSHAEIKSKCLNRFLTDLRRFHGVQNYVWKAELQKNGNVHFHLTFDKFIHYLQLRKLWNNAISKLGYVQRYAFTFQNMTEAEYIKFRRQSSPASQERLRKAYAYGVSTNWQSPNTTDVKNVKNVKDLAAYLSKYMAKPLSDKNSNKGQQESAATWSGRTWFCSTSLSRLKSKKIEIDFKTRRIFNWFRDNRNLYRVDFDFCQCVFFQLSKLPKQVREWLRQELLSHAINSRYPFPDAIPVW